MNWFNPDTSFTNDFFEASRFKLAWRLSVSFTLIFALLTVLFSNMGQVGFYIYLCVFLLSLGSLIYLHFIKNPKAIFWIFTISASILVIFSMNTIVETMHYTDIVWTMCIILFAFIGLSYRAAGFFILVHTFSLGYYILFELNHHLAVIQPREMKELVIVAIELVFAFFIMSYLVYENIRHHSYIGRELKVANILLARKNNENSTLLKEVHHRVKNNLQIVVSLLRMQNSDAQSKETKLQFNEAINRIMTISMIHEKLYQTGELSKLEFRNYITTLIEDIQNLHTMDDTVSIHVSSTVSKVDLKRIVPIGLLLNELITNSLKHAFSESEIGEIRIQFSEDDNRMITFTYFDSGNWKSASNGGFGSELLLLLTEQIDGELERNDSTYTIRFPSAE